MGRPQTIQMYNFQTAEVFIILTSVFNKLVYYKYVETNPGKKNNLKIQSICIKL